MNPVILSAAEVTELMDGLDKIETARNRIENLGTILNLIAQRCSEQRDTAELGFGLEEIATSIDDLTGVMSDEVTPMSDMLYVKADPSAEYREEKRDMPGEIQPDMDAEFVRLMGERLRRQSELIETARGALGRVERVLDKMAEDERHSEQ